MSRRGDNIRKRKDGRWEARYAINSGGINPKKYRSVYGKSYRQAKEKRDSVIKNAECQKALIGVVLFKDILNAWQDSNRVKLKEATISRYQNLIDSHILPSLGNKRVDQLDAPAINRFLAKKLEHGRLDGAGRLSEAYVRSIALIIGSAISYGVTEKFCVPLNSQITKPVPTKKDLCILSVENQNILEQELLTNMSEEKLLIYITLYTGLRIGEACALRWNDINFESRVIHVRQTVSRIWMNDGERKHSKLIIEPPKTKSSFRTIPICSKLYSILCSSIYRRREGYIMPRFNHNEFTSPRTFEYRYKKILKSCHLDPINYHALRHTFATRCIERGVDIKSLSEILGHADVSITLNTYVHSSIELKRIQLEKLIS